MADFASGNLADLIVGSTGNNALVGGDGADYIEGGAGDDYLDGSAGNDVDTLIGGTGNDTYAVTDAVEADIIVETATDGTDTLLFTDNLSVAAVKVGTTVAGAAVGSFSNIEQVVITGGKTATFASAQVTGLSLLVGEAGTGTSSLVVEASAAGSAIDLSGFKFATAGYSYTNSAGALTTMSDLTSGTDTIVINGSTGANTIKGTSYADIITGGAGVDDLTGGAGADAFVFAAGDSGTISDTVFDIVRDYTAGVGGDILNLAGSAAAQANATGTDVALAIASAAGGEVVTASIASGVITLGGANAGAINTLSEWLAVARIMVTGDTKVGAFVFGGDTYVYQENTGTNTDLLIQLDNVTGITALSGIAAANTIVIG